MSHAFLEELKTILAGGFTGSVVLHVEQGCVKQYELNERRRPRADGVELTEAGSGTG